MFDGSPVRPPAAFTLVDLTKRGLEAHLQEVVLRQLIQDQIQAFAEKLKPLLEHHIGRITIGHVEHVKDVLNIRDQLLVKVNCEFQDVENGASL